MKIIPTYELKPYDVILMPLNGVIFLLTVKKMYETPENQMVAQFHEMDIEFMFDSKNVSAVGYYLNECRTVDNFRMYEDMIVQGKHKANILPEHVRLDILNYSRVVTIENVSHEGSIRQRFYSPRFADIEFVTPTNIEDDLRSKMQILLNAVVGLIFEGQRQKVWKDYETLESIISYLQNNFVDPNWKTDLQPSLKIVHKNGTEETTGKFPEDENTPAG